MGIPVIFRRPSWLIFLWLVFFSVQAGAAIDNADVMDNVLNRYSTAAAMWGTIITSTATYLFWSLVVISMVITFGFMALRKADLGEFYAEFIRFILFTGFFWWALENGPAFATSIMSSLRILGARASGLPNALAPSGIVDIGFDIFWKILDQSTVWSPVDSAAGLVMSGIVLVVFALIGVNMLLLLVSGWILAYAGVFFLGFGGSRWTSDMAIQYYKTILNVAAQLMTMILLVGIGKAMVDQYYANMSVGMNLKELSVMMIVAIMLLAIVKTIPPSVGALAGGHTGSLGSGFGAGAVVGAAAMAGAAAATAGAAIAAGASGMAGGMQALMSAYSKASAAESAGGGAGSLLAAAGGGGGGGGTSNAANDPAGGSPLAAAMGDGGGGTSSGGSGGSGDEPQGVEPASKTDKGANEQVSASGNGGTGGAAADESKAAGETKRGGLGGKAARVGKIASGTAANLAVGAWDVAKAKGADLRGSAMDRIGESTGGKIANAINARATCDKVAKFGSESLSAAVDDKGLDAESEVAAFRDRGNKAS